MVAAVIVSLGSLFATGLLFLIAGLLTPGPLQRKGAKAHLVDRTRRLGVPFAAYVMLVYPIAEWAGKREGSIWDHLRDAWTRPEPGLDPGPMWFVGVWLLFTAVYVVWRQVRPGEAPLASAPVGARPSPDVGPEGVRRPVILVGVAAGIAVGTSSCAPGYR